MANEIKQLRLEVQKLRQDNNDLNKKHEDLGPIIRDITTNAWNLSEENKKLVSTNAKLQKKNKELDSQNVELQNINKKLVADSTALVKANAHLQKQVQQAAKDGEAARETPNQNTLQLSQDLEDAEDRVSGLEKSLQATQKLMGETIPLTEIGVAVRLRFWEQAKETCGLGRANRAIVKAGNEAAHRGAIDADTALFELGYVERIISTWPLDSEVLDSDDMDADVETELPPAEDSNTDEWETMKEDLESRSRSLKGLYQKLYRTEEVHPLDKVLYDMLPRTKEISNMFVTLGSCIRNFDPGNTGRNKDHVRFGELAKDCTKRYDEVPEGQSLFETSTEVMENLQEMQKIVDKTVQKKLSWVRRRPRGT